MKPIMIYMSLSIEDDYSTQMQDLVYCVLDTREETQKCDLVSIIALIY